MIRHIPALLGILLLQVLLIGLLSLSASDDDGAERFLTFDPAAVTELTISDAAGGSVILSRADAGWQLAAGSSAVALPADDGKISAVLESLTEGTATWPVATSANSQERFQVTAEDHQRQLRIASAEGPLAEIYLGTSPGFRRVHARAADEEAVFSIDFAVHEVPTDPSDWLDKKLLQTEAINRISSVDGRLLTRDSSGEGWLLDGRPADTEAADRFVERVGKLTVLGLYQGTEEAQSTLGDARTIVFEDGRGSARLTFRHDEEADEYQLTTDRLEGRFIVASYLAEQILIDGDDLLPAVEPPAAAVETDGTP